MLLKVFKHDFKTLSRYLIPVLFALLGVTALGCIDVFVINSYGTETDAGALATMFGSFGLIFIILAIFAVSTVMSIMIYIRFYKSMVTDEAYLTLTLPVKSRTLLTGKLFSALLWSLIGIVGTAISISLIALSIGAVTADFFEEFGFIFEVFFDGMSEIILGDWVAVALWALMTVVSWVVGFIQVFFAITFAGSIAKRGKVICAVGLILGFNFAVSTISSIINIVISTLTYMNETDVPYAVMSGNLVRTEYAVTLVLYTILGVVFFWLSTFLIKKKVNLD